MNSTRPWILSGAIALALLGCASAIAAEPRTIFIVHLVEPPAARFDSVDQVSAAKSLRLAPTSAQATGKRKFDSKSVASRRYAEFLHVRQDAVLAAAEQLFKRELTPRHRFEWVANGFTVALTESEATRLAAVPGVRSVNPDGRQQLQTDAGPQWIGADVLWNGVVQGSNVQTRGEGIVIGVIDTGINAAHPSFSDIAQDGYNHSNPRGVRFGLCNDVGETRCNDKLIGIYNFLSEPDGTPGSDVDGHGSHVASTAAGNPFPASGNSGALAVTLSGVAPRANIIMYKACGSGDIDCPYSALVPALNQAAADGVDVVNYSIGGDERLPWNDGVGDMQAFLGLRSAGIVSVVSAGNAGPAAATMLSPANAPWVIAASNISSNRIFANTVQGVSGTGIATPLDFVGVGLTSALSTRAIAHAKDFGDNDCGAGPSQDPPYTGASNPFAAGTFSGQIVICERTGIYARVEKGDNVRRAGAGGMILVNTSAAQTLVADDHFLPAVHLDLATGDQLEARVEAARLAGGSVSGSLSGAQRVLGDTGDGLIWHSSRGPNKTYDGVLKPGVAAPGTGILAASNVQNLYSIKSGTSMAAPHVAGAAALLLAAHPTWTVAQVDSALLGTASNTVVHAAGRARARFNEGGAGRVQLPLAVRSALHLAVTTADFTAASPATGGDPRQLNLPSLHTSACRETCTFNRTVTDNGLGGSWQVIAEPSNGASITVTPSSFNLAPGQSQALQIVVDVRASSIVGKWMDGAVRLRANGVPDVVMPVSVFAPPGVLPESITIETQSSSGSSAVVFKDLVALSDATFRDSTYALVAPLSVTLPVGGSDISSAYDPDPVIAARRRVELFSKPVGSSNLGRLNVELQATNNSAAWLLVGRDLNGNGLADPDEVLCQQTTAVLIRRCAVDTDWTLAGSRYWAMVYNGSSSATVAATLTPLNVLNDAEADTGIVVSGPRRIARLTDIPVRVGWNLPQLRVGETIATILRIGADRNNVGAVGNVPVFIRRTAVGEPKAIVLDGRGDSISLYLSAGQAHERIVIDVPPNAVTLTVSTQAASGEIDLYLAKAAAAPTPPMFAAAPARGLAQGTSIHPGANETITLNTSGTPALTPGRWYVTPVNAGGGDATVTLTANLIQSGTITQPGDNAYRNPARSGHGLYLAKAAGVWAAAWHTYEADGKPVWYLASAAAPAPNDGVWTAPLLRFGWNGTTTGNGSLANTVGKMMLTFDGSGGFTYSWLLNGEFGSEPFSTVAPISCVQQSAAQRSISGAWYAPDNGGWGLFVFGFASGTSFFDANAVYVYDDLGNPRWLLGSGDMNAAEVSLLQYTGFCPTCAFSAVTSAPVGSMQRSYSTNSTAIHVLSAPNYANGVPGGWNVNKSTTKLTREVPCQ
ncbi:MAG: S8 family serine peptidase [Pseudomonadota bacterium]|nr:S8 family serine peptidase [Pseudomonadota bacterium]